MWEYLIGKIIVHIVHLESWQEVVLGNCLIHDSKLEQDHRCFVCDKNEVPVIICLWWPFKIMSSPKELLPSGWLLALRHGSNLGTESKLGLSWTMTNWS